MSGTTRPSIGIEAIEARILEILRQGLDLEVTADTDVIETGLLDSLRFVELLVGLEEAFGVEVDVEDVELDDFRSAGAIASFLGRRYEIT